MAGSLFEKMDGFLKAIRGIALDIAVAVVALFALTVVALTIYRLFGFLGEKRQKGGQERGSYRGRKAPKKGPPHLTDILCLETVPDAGVRRDVDGGTL